jgi:hypothetical protein
MLQMWGETSLINYEDFVLLMKGQKKLDCVKLRSSLQGEGSALAEILEEEEFNATPRGSDVLEDSSPHLDSLLAHYRRRTDDIDFSSLSMEDDAQRTVSFSEQYSEYKTAGLISPHTPARVEDFHPELISRPCPPLLPLPGARALHASLVQDPFADYPSVSLMRGRSVSLDERDTVKEEAGWRKSRDSRQAMIPEHVTCLSDIDRVVQDETKTPLVVNRTLYRAHREFRLTLTEACKRFEDEQIRRAKETLRAHESAGTKYIAGLVMRHGQALSDESIKKFLAETMEEQQKQVDQANRRGGRGRHSRKKTNSDMSGMLSGPTPPLTLDLCDVKEPIIGEALASIKEDDDTVLRHPTIPGEFRTTSYDPFHGTF